MQFPSELRSRFWSPDSRQVRRSSSRADAFASRLILFLLVAACDAGLCLGTTVVTDGTLGKSTLIPNVGGTLQVTPDLGRIRGRNLFQSFGQFSISSGDTVNFIGPSKIQNVIARVTGGQQSDIDGTIQSVPGSSFYLINSAGVVFGPHAVLNVDNLFAVSTADYLRLKDGSRFSASPAANPLLSMAAPAAFGFLNTRPAPITIAGDPNDPTAAPLKSAGAISIVGGDITISAQKVLANELTLRSIAGRGELSVAGPTAAPRAIRGTITVTDGSKVEALGPLTIDAGTVNISGESKVASFTEPPTGNGAVVPASLAIDADTLNVSGLSMVGCENDSAARGGDMLLKARSALNVTDAYIAADSESTGRGGNVRVESPQVMLNGLNDSTISSGIFTEADDDGAAGNVTITHANQVDVTQTAFISATTFAAGRGGSIFVNANSVMLYGEDSFTFTGIAASTQNVNFSTDPESVTGPGGAVHLHATSLQILHGATIVSNSLFPDAGKGGAVDVNAPRILIDGLGVGPNIDTSIDAVSGDLEPNASGTFVPVAGGPGGTVNVKASNLRILDGGGISTNTSGPDNAGRINVRANNIIVDNIGSTSPAGISAETEGGVSGNGGEVSVHAPRIQVSNGGRISVQTNGSGSAGDAKVWADNLTVASGGRIQSNATSSGNGGDLRITVARSLRVETGGLITASAAQGAGGDVRISSGNYIVLDDGSITTGAAQNGGNVDITAPAYFDLRNDSQITTSSGGANGGNITVDPLELSLLSGSAIKANGSFNGGNIILSADRRTGVVTKVGAPDANITAFGGIRSGAIIAAPEQLDLIGSLVPLRIELETAARLVPQCAAQFNDYQSSFVVTGRGGTPVGPGGWFPDLSLQPETHSSPD